MLMADGSSDLTVVLAVKGFYREKNRSKWDLSRQTVVSYEYK